MFLRIFLRLTSLIYESIIDSSAACEGKPSMTSVVRSFSNTFFFLQLCLVGFFFPLLGSSSCAKPSSDLEPYRSQWSTFRTVYMTHIFCVRRIFYLIWNNGAYTDTRNIITKILGSIDTCTRLVQFRRNFRSHKISQLAASNFCNINGITWNKISYRYLEVYVLQHSWYCSEECCQGIEYRVHMHTIYRFLYVP